MRRVKLCLLLALLATLVLTLSGCACKHAETTLVNIVNATCTQDGYTGDVQCTKCNEIVQEGVVVPATGHTPGELTGAVEATCAAEGFTGTVSCTVCGEVLEEGAAIPVIDHVPGEPEGAVEATCAAEGFTGKIVCAVCGEVLEEGEAIPMIDHVPGEPEGAAEATCTAEGATGKVVCTVCGEVLEEGEAIPMIDHVPGEPEGAVEATCTAEGATGKVVCTVCGEVLEEGEAIPAGHSYENNVCVRCGWREPGLYVGDELVATWEQLLENGQLTVYPGRGQLQSIKGDFGMGTLVISEEITYVAGIHNKTVKEIWVPATVTKLGAYILYGNSVTETVRLFCADAEIPENALTGSSAAFVTAE